MNIRTITSRNQPDRLLRIALRGNGVFSGLSGLVFLVAANPVASLIGIPWPGSLTVIGVALIGYATALLYSASRHSIDWRVAVFFTIMDLAWVAGSLVLLFADWVPFTTAGPWVIAILADIVAVFAALQIWGLWQNIRSGAGRP